jgi:hypothetical protein
VGEPPWPPVPVVLLDVVEELVPVGGEVGDSPQARINQGAASASASEKARGKECMAARAS